ncbi:fatty acid oxidation complex subunit alpha FadB [Vibrio sp. CAIM 722]|uniref:enoyl-CoA hydratase n=1 Tax=Vibrio eleionomae TaxID=2653505 RepID=A0A7X4LLI3_9VIBR|nr:fatty acid oxidation complex subunit alpha FadB [Vibrio eleionomae]MZI93852.1 fatty acid oxidation complex subunit alpha FadB [Vibrio eleionomae]
MLYQTSNLYLKARDNHIVELCFSSKSSVNKLDLQTLQHLDEALDILHQHKTVKGLIITTDKDSFIVGADITQFLSLFTQPEEVLSYWLVYANSVFNKLEDLPFPTISALTGHVLGGGCECVLTTDFRVGDTTTNIGLPETKLGIIPGFGGTVRLPRLIGPDSAMEAITQARTYSAYEALKIGILDAVTTPEHLFTSALTTLNEAISHKLDWKKKRTVKLSPLALNHTEQLLSFTIANSLVTQKAGAHYSAPKTAVSVIQQAAQCHRPNALEIERNAFIKLTQTPQAHALIGIFLNDQSVKTKARRMCSAQITEPSHIGVVGAGIMGGGIAYQAASHNNTVQLKDINQEALNIGLAHSAKLLKTQWKRGKIDENRQADVLNKITASLSYDTFDNVDTVIEAVVENANIKSAVLKEIESHVSTDTIITSNTSTIPIEQLALSLNRPERFCGMHFFNPVHKMPLVEIIRGKQTNEATINQIVSLALQLNKSPIVVNDCPGFFVNRVLFPYLMAFRLLLKDGIDFVLIDKVMEQEFGWPMGPAWLLDIVGIDTAYHAQTVMNQGYPDRFKEIKDDVVALLFERQWLGNKTQQGFYCYSTDKKGHPIKQPNPELIELLSTQPHNKDHNEQMIIDRMMIPMINESILCLEQNIISTAEEIDMALVYGLGFPPFRGGPCRYLETIGIDNYLRSTQPYQHLGPLYIPPNHLIQMNKSGKTFYSHHYQSPFPEPLEKKDH